MRDSQEAAFLAKIAENPVDNVGRLVLADYLEERGDNARAEFIRVQCELTSNHNLPDEQRRQLREREYTLLLNHREEWIAAFELPIVDVQFHRGLISAARLAEWNEGRFLKATHMWALATLEELDLSGLKLQDENAITFAKKANFPALKKLLLCNNELSERGTSALFDSRGYMNLETLYLFGNMADEATIRLRQTSTFTLLKLQNVDLGERRTGYAMSRGQAEVARRTQMRQNLLPIVLQTFQKHPLLRSAVLCTAQYWNDEANDAVHAALVVSEHLEPILVGVNPYPNKPEVINIPNTTIEQDYGESSSMISLWNAGFWDDNNGAIPLWSAYCSEDGSQEFESLDEVYTPAVKFFRHGGYEFLPMLRPQLDGIMSEWGAEDLGAFAPE